MTNPDGQSAGTLFDPSPVVMNVINGQGPAAGGASFVMTGSFIPGTTVQVGGVAATILTLTPNVLVVVAPGSVSVASVVITSPSGCEATTSYTRI